MDRTGLIKVKNFMQVMRNWAARCMPWVGLVGILGASQQVWAQTAPVGDYEGSPQVARFVGEMTRDYGFAGEQLMGVFREVERKQAILDAISRPAERVKPWREYRPMFLTDARIARGVDFWRQNQAALARAEREYGVPAQVIVAIIGVETFFGRNTGNYRVIDALSTLGFDYPPRAEFFRKELREFLLMARAEQLDPLLLKGSYAGAMGLPQFMPSSFRAYAVDFDGDGHINLWTDPADAIGSVANYFKQHGWVAGQGVVSLASVRGERVDEGLSPGIEPVKTVGELRALGWSGHDALRDDLPVTAFRLDGANGPEYWMGLKNFYAITRYNRSVMYAMAVHQLSEALVQARGVK
jgi:membrane-bound lytic murein transglycosylase B